MLYCVNFGCSNKPSKKRIRCGHCRQHRIQVCGDCGIEIQKPRSTRCYSCDKISTAVQVSRQSFHDTFKKKGGDKWCKNCGSIIVLEGRSAHCSEKCKQEAIQIRLDNRRQESECVMCFEPNPKWKYLVCSDECHKYFRRIYLQHLRGNPIRL